MSYRRPKPCKDCGKVTSDLSRHGLCFKCSSDRMIKSMAQLADHDGPIYEKWKANLSRSLRKRKVK